MFEQLCPACGKKSYSSDEEYFSPCPYCGARFSRKHGSDKRREERVRKEGPVYLICRGRRIEATLTDFSERGLGVTIFGEFPAAAGETVEITNDLQIKAKVMWMNKLPDVCRVGLQKLG